METQNIPSWTWTYFNNWFLNLRSWRNCGFELYNERYEQQDMDINPPLYKDKVSLIHINFKIRSLICSVSRGHAWKEAKPLGELTRWGLKGNGVFLNLDKFGYPTLGKQFATCLRSSVLKDYMNRITKGSKWLFMLKPKESNWIVNEVALLYVSMVNATCLYWFYNLSKRWWHMSINSCHFSSICYNMNHHQDIR